MKLSVSFKSLEVAVNMMEPEDRGQFNLAYQETSIEKLDLELASGKDVELKDVDIEAGLLSYKGRNVSLYIKANGSSARFHVANCKTLQSMRANGRFERYVVTNDTSGEFVVASGYGYGETKARLKVCQNCLRQLNYKGCNTGTPISSIVQQFDMAQFFATYSSFFPYMPSRKAETAETGYTENWAKVSSHYRVEKDFECEQCNVNLRTNRGLLHVHHISGVKSNNKASNLIALCIDCHSKQPMHSHMAVSHSERQLINKLRQEQGLLEDLGGWQELFDYSDPGVHGVLHACRQQNYVLPEVAYYIQDEFDDLVAKVELAWPGNKFGVAIANVDVGEAKECGWEIISVSDFLEGYKTNANHLRRGW
ncbi:HNH endonuclease [Aliivibrio kagoshimensis]|uniref:HNH endonuclease n=1 Tax=Aliivibrio kagoshimensis TaxID=2910230 RepID=UPI003D0A9FF7